MTTQATFEITATDKTAAAFASIDKNLAALAGKASSVTHLVEGYFGFEGLEKVIEITAENEKAQALLASQIKATGDASGYTLEQLTDMADGFQHTTSYSHVQIEQLEGQLLAFRNIAGAQFKGAIQAALDFATVTGRDPVEAVRVLGLALNDPVSGMKKLSRAGIDLSAATKATIKDLQEQGNVVGAQDVLLKEMEKSYGGAAAAARDTLGGALAGLKNDFTDLLEAKGGGVQAAVEGINQLDKTLEDPEAKQGIATLVSGLLGLVGAVAKVGAAFSSAATDVGEFFAKLQGYGGNFDDQINDAKTHIQQTQDQIDGLINGGTPKDSPAIKQLQDQLLKYQNQLIQAQTQQQLLTGKTAGPTGPKTFTAGDLDTLEAPDVGNLKSIDHSQELDPGRSGGLVTQADQLKEDQAQVLAIWKQNDPAAYIQQQIDKTKELVGTVVNGEIFTTDDAKKHIADLNAEMAKSEDQMSAFADQAARNIQDTFANALFQPFHHGLRGMLEDFAKTVEKMVDQLIAAQLLNHFFGDADPSNKGSGQAGLSAVIAKGLSSYFGGGHAGGGDVDPNNFYLVGENGPELFAPSSAGSIVPNYALGGSGGGNTTVHIDARGADPASTARLIAFGAAMENSIKGQMEYRLQRGGWPHGRRQP